LKKFLLVNENGSDNIGDHAINEGLKELLTESDCQFNSEPFSTTHVHQAPVNTTTTSLSLSQKLRKLLFSFKPFYLLMWLLKHKGRIKQACSKDYDGIIIGGGQLILSGASFPPALYAWARYARKRKIPLYLLGVGCGEHFYASETWLIKQALKCAEKIYVREYQSVTKLKQHFDVEASFCPDLAFGLQPLASDNERKNILVGMTDFAVYTRYCHEVDTPKIANYKDYLDTWYNQVLSMYQPGMTIVLASTTLSDAQCNRDLYQLLNNSTLKDNIRLIDGVLPLSDYRIELSRAKTVYSARMHSLILGKIEGATIEPWIISKKIENFLGLYTQQNAAELKLQLREVTKLLGAESE